MVKKPREPIAWSTKLGPKPPRARIARAAPRLAAEVTPSTEIDGIAVGSGAIGAQTKRLEKLYFDLVTGNADDTRGWLTAV